MNPMERSRPHHQQDPYGENGENQGKTSHVDVTERVKKLEMKVNFSVSLLPSVMGWVSC